MFVTIPGYEFLPNVINSDAHRKVISEQSEGNVYLITKHNDNFIVKERAPSKYDDKFCNICVEREFRVGELANVYNSPYLVKTLGYYVDNPNDKNLQSSYIITEYIRGISLFEYVTTYDFDPIIYMQLLYTVKHLQEEMLFTHYDLHFENVIVEIIDTPITRTYFFNGLLHVLVTPFNIKIIDLARCHIRGVESSYYETAIVDEATCPGIFDPIFDLATILASTNYKSFAIDKLFIANGFSIGKNRDNKVSIMRGYPLINNIFRIGDLINYKHWCSTYPGIYTQKNIYYMYSKEIMERKNVTLEDIKEFFTSEETDSLYEGYLIESFANIQHDDNNNDLIEKYIVLLGQACVHDKLLAMKSRKNTPDEFFNSCVEIIESLS